MPCLMCGGSIPASNKRGSKSPCCSDICRRRRENECARRLRKSDPERFRTYSRQWCAANPDKTAKYRATKAEWMKVYSRKYYLAHRDKWLERGRRKVETGAAKAAWYRAMALKPEKYRLIGRKKAGVRRARRKNAFIEPVDAKVVFDRDGGVCGICLQPVLPGQAWHVDHIEPLSKGGAHSYDNAQLAHAGCNMSKSARIVPGQGVLFRRAG